MRVLCSVDNVEVYVSEYALSRSPLLADVVSSCVPEGSVQLPCDSRTLEAWYLGDTATIHDATRILAVLEVRCWAVSLIGSQIFYFFLNIPKLRTIVLS
jgi:hypothetical protein